MLGSDGVPEDGMPSSAVFLGNPVPPFFFTGGGFQTYYLYLRRERNRKRIRGRRRRKKKKKKKRSDGQMANM